MSALSSIEIARAEAKAAQEKLDRMEREAFLKNYDTPRELSQKDIQEAIEQSDLYTRVLSLESMLKTLIANKPEVIDVDTPTKKRKRKETKKYETLTDEMSAVTIVEFIRKKTIGPKWIRAVRDKKAQFIEEYLKENELETKDEAEAATENEFEAWKATHKPEWDQENTFWDQIKEDWMPFITQEVIDRIKEKYPENHGVPDDWTPENESDTEEDPAPPAKKKKTLGARTTRSNLKF